ncbi:tyrosine-type recombinase/integrase [Flagellimonas sp. C4]|uniref:site-specific integrase n=1 Tax=Flagellimonas alginolytica TaxID=3177515 RepID=UPI0035C92306
MLHISFNLRHENINKKGLAPVRLIISYNSLIIRKMVPSVRVLPKDWQNERIKTNLKNEPYNFHLEYNFILDEIDAKVKALYRQSLIAGKSLSKDDIINCLDNKTSSKVAMDLFSALDEFVYTHRAVRAHSTIKKYNSCIQFIKDFENATGFGLGFESIDQVFLETFRDYAFLKRNTMNNYYSKLIAFIKTFMNWALDREYHNNVEFRKFKRTEDNIEVIFLTIDELMTLYHHDFESRRLSAVRDIYCFGCFTGLRFSDLSTLQNSNIFEDHIQLTIQKSKRTDHRIPLNKMAKKILKKYTGTVYEPLPRISGQKFNQYIKECCEEIGMDQPINITRYVGQKRIDKTAPKYSLITSHTARKTFVTNSLILGMNERVLKNITGHKDDVSFMKYLKIAEDFKRNEMNNTWDKL